MSDSEDRRPAPAYARPLAKIGSKISDRIFKLIKNCTNEKWNGVLKISKIRFNVNVNTHTHIAHAVNEEDKSKSFVRGVKFVNKAIRKDRKGYDILSSIFSSYFFFVRMQPPTH